MVMHLLVLLVLIILILIFIIIDLKNKLIHDQLTKTYNRYFLNKLFKKNLKGYIMCVIDIDNFKQINDKYGHLVGDEVLINISNIFIKAVKNGYVIRWGGDEFVVIFKTNDITYVNLVINNIKCQVNRYKLNNNFNHKISISSNITEISDGNLNNTFESADYGLYQQKNKKNNA